MKKFILNPTAKFQSVVSDRVDVGVWTVDKKSLVLATNLNYNATTFSLNQVHGASSSKVSQVFNSGASVSGKEIHLESVGTGAFILTHS